MLNKLQNLLEQNSKSNEQIIEESKSILAELCKEFGTITIWDEEGEYDDEDLCCPISLIQYDDDGHPIDFSVERVLLDDEGELIFESEDEGCSMSYFIHTCCDARYIAHIAQNAYKLTKGKQTTNKGENNNVEDTMLISCYKETCNDLTNITKILKDMEENCARHEVQGEILSQIKSAQEILEQTIKDATSILNGDNPFS